MERVKGIEPSSSAWKIANKYDKPLNLLDISFTSYHSFGQTCKTNLFTAHRAPGKRLTPEPVTCRTLSSRCQIPEVDLRSHSVVVSTYSVDHVR